MRLEDVAPGSIAAVREGRRVVFVLVGNHLGEKGEGRRRRPPYTSLVHDCEFESMLPNLRRVRVMSPTVEVVKIVADSAFLRRLVRYRIFGGALASRVDEVVDPLNRRAERDGVF